MRKPSIAIVGGGIGGLLAACALRQRNFEVRLYEASPELKEIGAGVSLAPNAMKVLRSLGLEAAVRGVGWEWEHRLTRHWQTGRVTSREALQDSVTRYGAAICNLHRADLLDVLAGALPPDVKITLGARAVSVTTDDVLASVTFSDGSQIEADVVVGADGIHSAVRTSLFGPDAPRFTGQFCYRGLIPIADLPEKADMRDASNVIRGPHSMIVMFGVRRGELLNVVCNHDGADYKHESWVTECSREEVLECYRDWNEWLLSLFSASSIWYKWALYDRDPIPRWTEGRVALLGDAAHPMLPYLGQGACQAIEDGCVLGAAFDQIPDDVPGALRLYERVRRPRASRVVLTSREHGLDNHLVSPIAAWKRDLKFALRKRFTSDVSGRGDTWIPDYDASSPDVFVG